jgi:hypothetical protein
MTGGAPTTALNTAGNASNTTTGGSTANTGGAIIQGGGNPGTSTGNPGGANTGAPAPAPPPAASVPFALNPGVAMGNMILDYNQKAHKWLYKQTVRSLYSDHNDKFDLSVNTIQVFLTKISLRLNMVGSLILWAFSQARHICQCHAEYTLLQFIVKAHTYMGTPTRMAQDDNTLLQCYSPLSLTQPLL